MARELKNASPDSPARSNQITLGEAENDIFLIYVLLVPQKSQDAPFFIVSGMRKKKVFDYSELDLTAAEKNLLLAARQGTGLFFAGRQHVAIQIIPSYFEDRIITTDPKQLLAERG